MTAAERFVIVGAGQAGLQLAESLRLEGFDGEILLLGSEHHAPYQRPPLSKAWLAGETADDRLVLRGPEFLAERKISLRTGARVEQLDLDQNLVVLAGGEQIAFSGLALATGARARRPELPGAERAFVLRDLDDARALSQALDGAKNVAIVGGGFIGLEVAAAARKRGCGVTLIESLDRLMARAVSPKISEFFAQLHRAHGVDILFGEQAAEILDDGVGLVGGKFCAADVVVFGVGAIANDALARAAGIFCDRGVVVDRLGRSSRQNIMAAGDCAVLREPDGRLRRFESVQFAVESAKAAAASLMGRSKPFLATPWFWSDQYDVKLQIAGQVEGADLFVERAGPGGFSLFAYTQRQLIGVESVNRPGDHLFARKCLDAGRSPDPALVGDAGADLKALLR